MKLHTTRRGHGPLLLCHPGGPGFDGSELGDLGGLDRTRELVLIDPRGTRPTGAADSYRLEDYADDLEELRKALELDDVDLLGFSHGALVAAAYAASRPERVRKLVLASGLVAFTDEMQAEAERAVAARDGQPWHAAAVAALAREEAGAYETGEDAAAIWNDMIPLYFADWHERFRPLVESEWLAPEPLHAFNSSSFDLRPDLDAVAAETLVVTGREDFVCGPAVAEAIVAAIPGAELVLIDGAGHFPFLEQPAAFTQAVEAFLAR